MAYKTLQALVTDTEKALYQAAGPGVQIYAQDVLIQQLQNAFDFIFLDYWWPQFIRREVRTLDGVSGLVTVPFALITHYEDIKAVFRRNSDRPLPELPLSYNSLDYPTGSLARHIEATGDSNLFRVYPTDALDNIVVVGRTRPATDFISTDVVPFDSTALVHYAAWSYFTDDESNPAAAAKHQGLFEKRMQQLKDALPQVVELNPRHGYVPDQWSERG
jgi:hypothetical protein